MKRKRKSHRDGRAAKRQKTESATEEGPTWPLLRQYYPEVLTFRQYLASKSCNVPKKCRKRLLQYGINDDGGFSESFDPAVVRLLDDTVVGRFKQAETVERNEAIEKDLAVFTQQVSESSATITPTQGALKQSEVSHVYFSLCI